MCAIAHIFSRNNHILHFHGLHTRGQKPGFCINILRFDTGFFGKTGFFGPNPDLPSSFNICYMNSTSKIENPKPPDAQLDLRGTPCPLNFVRTKLRLE